VVGRGHGGVSGARQRLRPPVEGAARRQPHPEERGPHHQVRLARCSSERGVTLYRIEGGGHQVFGHTNFFPLFLGSGTSRISAPDTIMAEFAKR
jgi:poly(3-hydroxybutyrate) depolymerase